MPRLKRKSVVAAVGVVIVLCLGVVLLCPMPSGGVPMVVAWRVWPVSPLTKLDELLAKGRAGSQIEVDVAISNHSLNTVCISSIVVRRGRVRFVTANGYIEFDASDQFVSSIQSKGTAHFASNLGTAKICFNGGVVRLWAVHPDWTAASMPSDKAIEAMEAEESEHAMGHRLPVRRSGIWEVHRMAIEFSEDFDGELSDSTVGRGK